MQYASVIISALQTGVIAAMEQSDNPDLPVKHLMTDAAFDTPDDQKWLELVWIPNDRTGDFLGAEQNYQGLLRLILHWPNEPVGVYEPLELLASITRYFTIGKTLSDVQVYAIPTFNGLVENGAETLFPATVQYRSYRKGI